MVSAPYVFLLLCFIYILNILKYKEFRQAPIPYFVIKEERATKQIIVIITTEGLPETVLEAPQVLFY